MSPIIYPASNSGQAYSVLTDRRKSSLKRRLVEDRLPPGGEGWTRIPQTPGLALKWPHPCSLHIEWGSRGCPPNVNLRTTGSSGNPGLAAGKGWRWEKSPSAEGIILNSWVERRTKTQERTETGQQTPDIKRVGETRGNQLICLPHYVNSPWLSVALEDPPCLWAWSLIKINSLHNNIWFICLNFPSIFLISIIWFLIQNYRLL